MSEEPSSKPPLRQQETPGEKPPSSGPNWRVMILFGFAILILVLAWYSNAGGNVKQMDFSEFRTNFDKGVVLKDPLELSKVQAADDKSKDAVLKEMKLSKADRLTFLTQETSASGTLQGKYDVSEYRDLDAKPELKPFRVEIDTSLNADQLDRMLSYRSVPLITVPEISEANDSDTGSLKDLRKWLAMDDVVLNGENALKIFKKAGVNDAVLEGTRKVWPVKSDVSPKWESFAVSVKTFGLSEHDNDLISKHAKLKRESNTMQMVLWNLLPILLILLVLFFLFRHQMKNAGKGAMNFGKSKAKLLSQDKGRVTFKDVAGIQEAKEELYEIVDFLKDPKKFEMLGGNIPKGVLMVGSPGTGKTLLARAIAGEADVPFFSISGSDFVEMFVGVGASRVRDMFEQGKKNSPCIVFIDEIDAVGRHRGQGMGGGHDEREQTLNALLVEMDGFDARSGVIIIAATNRPDVLDPALLRPGRFDRQVRVSLPDVNGREQILRVHAKKIKLAEGTDLAAIARGTPGFSGAELANLINEAALLAARQNKKEVTIAEMEEARDKVRWGRERRSLALSEDDKRKTAYHEAGHAILNVLCKHTDPLHKVTIIPRGPSLGSTMFLPEKDKFSYHKKEMLDELVVLMGGRVAEEIMLDDIASGAMGDIRMATNLARNMVCEWGMSDALGMVEYGGGDGEQFVAKPKTYSEGTAQLIDAEIKRLIDEGYQRATDMLGDRKDLLELIAEALLEYETLDGTHIKDLMDNGSMSNPPSVPGPPDAPVKPETSEASAKKAKESDDGDDPLAGEVVGAPA